MNTPNTLISDGKNRFKYDRSWRSYTHYCESDHRQISMQWQKLEWIQELVSFNKTGLKEAFVDFCQVRNIHILKGGPILWFLVFLKYVITPPAGQIWQVHVWYACIFPHQYGIPLSIAFLYLYIHVQLYYSKKKYILLVCVYAPIKNFWLSDFST